jgi:hypothetical protein
MGFRYYEYKAAKKPSGKLLLASEFHSRLGKGRELTKYKTSFQPIRGKTKLPKTNLWNDAWRKGRGSQFKNPFKAYLDQAMEVTPPTKENASLYHMPNTQYTTKTGKTLKRHKPVFKEEVKKKLKSQFRAEIRRDPTLFKNVPKDERVQPIWKRRTPFQPRWRE